MKKVMTIFGTRPEAVKLAPVVSEIKKRTDMESLVCVTAQHREMLDQVLEVFNIRPDLDLDLMQQNQTLASLTARVVEAVDRVLSETRPDLILVQGDTTTIMASALAAFYLRIPVGHVEAGLRSGDIFSPFPEEMNRRVASIVAAYHFAPTARAREALLREGVSPERVWTTGNTVIDALLHIVDREEPPEARAILDKCVLPDGRDRALILVTAHRRENFGERIESICRGLAALVERNPDLVVVYPVHPNPNIKETVFRLLQGKDRVILTDPVNYDALTHLMNAARLVLTDSGGIQEEAPSLGKPVLVMRTETERPEGVEAGAARLIGPFAEKIVAETEKLLGDPAEYEKMARVINPYGDGRAARRIVDIISKSL